MIVCSCNQLTDRQVLESLTSDSGNRPRSPGQVYRCLGCKPNCGRCVRQIRQLFQDIVQGECAIGCATCPGDAQAATAHPAGHVTVPAPAHRPHAGQMPHSGQQPHPGQQPYAAPDAWRTAATSAPTSVSGRRGFVVPEAQRYAPPPTACCGGATACCATTQQHPRPHNDDVGANGLVAAE